VVDDPGRSDRQVDAVLLDVGGVFTLPDPAVLLPVVRAAGATRATAEGLARGHYAGIAAMDASALAKGVTADWPAYHAALTAELHVPDAAVADVRAALSRAYVGLPWSWPVPGALDALRRLAATGVALVIVSNSDGTVEELLVTLGICQVGVGAGVTVDAVFDSHRVGVEKPDPAIFHRALEEIGVAPARALHVGDTGWADIAGARAAGVRPVHLDPFGFCPIPDDHEHIRHLDGVIALVSGPARA